MEHIPSHSLGEVTVGHANCLVRKGKREENKDAPEQGLCQKNEEFSLDRYWEGGEGFFLMESW